MYFIKKIVLVLLFYVIGLKSQSIPGSTPSKAVIDMSKKPVLCEYIGSKILKDSNIPDLEPECITNLCDIVVYSDFFIDNGSKITVDEDILKRLTNVKPVIISLNRYDGYEEWSTILKPDGNKEEIKILIDFAKAHPNVIGYLVKYLVPDIYDPVFLNLDVTKNIIPYLKDLKYSKDFIIGISLYPYGSLLKNPCITDCISLNDIVDFFEFRTYFMNLCFPKINNSYDPIKIKQHGLSYLMSMEEATKNLKETNCNTEKMYYAIGIAPVNKFGDRVDYTYKDVCTGNYFDEWCVENTEDYFNKGIYVKQQDAGITIRPFIFDDITNACGCGSFIMTRNILAGYRGEKQIPCLKADVRKSLL